MIERGNYVAKKVNEHYEFFTVDEGEFVCSCYANELNETFDELNA